MIQETPFPYRRMHQLERVGDRFKSEIDGQLYELYEETPEYHEDYLEERRQVIDALREEASQNGQAIFLVSGTGSDYGTLTLSGRNDKLVLCDVYAQERLEPMDLVEIQKDEARGFPSVVVDAKRITKGAVNKALPRFLDQYFPQLAKLPFVVYDYDDTGLGEYIDQFDFAWTQNRINELVEESVENNQVKLSYWNPFEEDDWVLLMIEGHKRHYALDGNWSYAEETLATAYGKQYLSEFEREEIEVGLKHFVLETGTVTPESLRAGVGGYISTYYPQLQGVLLSLENFNDTLQNISSYTDSPGVEEG